MPTNLYGTGDNYDLNSSHVLPALIRKFCEAKKINSKNVICWGDGSPLREFLHCDDLGDACVFTLENINSEILRTLKKTRLKESIHINVGTGFDLSIKELAQIIVEEVEYEGDILWDTKKPNGTHQKKLDISIMNQLGWNHTISLKDGIRKTIKEFKAIYF